jgi:hypothetical protein
LEIAEISLTLVKKIWPLLALRPILTFALAKVSFSAFISPHEFQAAEADPKIEQRNIKHSG